MQVELKCPRCKSVQKFRRFTESHADEHRILIRCHTCKWEKVLYSGSYGKIKLLQEIYRMKLKALADHKLNERVIYLQNKLRQFR
jgi:ribosomal protein S27E